MPPRQDTRARWRTHGTGRITVCELHPRRRKFVDVWRLVKLAAETTHIRPAHVIDQEENEVRLFGGSGGTDAQEAK